jgi:Uma2 family endonuclease
MGVEMSTAVRKRLYTFADLKETPDDGRRYEILEGDLFVTPPPNADHQMSVLKLARLMADYVEDRGLGLVLISPFAVRLGESDVPEPDVLFLSKERLPLLKKDCVDGAPDLVVEVLSPGTQHVDRTKKRDLYRRAGVREYWIVDPEARIVEVHDFSGRVTTVFQAGQTLRSEVLPGFCARVETFFPPRPS